MKVDIERILKIKKELSAINNEDLSNIVFYENGKEIVIDKKKIADFALVGLNNVDFITAGIYKMEDA